jgi:L-ribulose-5-phosphate 4-epimerase
MSEGIIKFTIHLEKEYNLTNEEIADLNKCREVLFNKNLIGVNSEGIGYGNISKRIKGGNKFIITGSATGSLSVLTPNDFVEVSHFNIFLNEIWCRGMREASSESLTHAAVYEHVPLANVVIHVHSEKLWNKYKNKLPTTHKNVTYGTPEMAYEVGKMAAGSDKDNLVIVMGGHPDGMISFAPDFGTAVNNLISLP